jgi:hypothetical protein
MPKTRDVRVQFYIHENEVISHTTAPNLGRVFLCFSGRSRNTPANIFTTYDLAVAEQRPRFGAGED